MSLWTLLCALVHSHVGTGRGHSHTVPTNLGAWNCLYAEAFRVPFTGNKGPSPVPEKHPHTTIPPPPNFTLGTMQSGKYRNPGNCQTQTRPSDWQMEKYDSSIQRTHLHCSRVQRRQASNHCIRCFALHLLMYGLDAAARPWKPIPWSSLRTVLELIWRPNEVWRSVVIDSAESWQPLRTTCLSIHWSCSVILCDLPCRDWVSVIPNHFHFVIIPLTVDCGIFRSKEISQLDLLHRWHPVTVPCWNSLSSWEEFVCLFVENLSACLCACFYMPVGMEVIGTSISIIWMGEWIL